MAGEAKALTLPLDEDATTSVDCHGGLTVPTAEAVSPPIAQENVISPSKTKQRSPAGAGSSSGGGRTTGPPGGARPRSGPHRERGGGSTAREGEAQTAAQLRRWRWGPLASTTMMTTADDGPPPPPPPSFPSQQLPEPGQGYVTEVIAKNVSGYGRGKMRITLSTLLHHVNGEVVAKVVTVASGGWKRKRFGLAMMVINLFIFLFLAGQAMAPPSHGGGISFDAPPPSRKGGSFDAWLAQAGPTPAHLARSVRPVIALPNNSNPFVFFHLRKAGGSTLRHAIYDTAIKHGLAKDTLWVPCKFPTNCQSFHIIPRESLKAVYASHINHEELVQARRLVAPTQHANNPWHWNRQKLANGENTTYYHMDDTLHHFNCLTNLRPTVSRVVSCYNYRFKQDAKQHILNWTMPYANELAPDDWASLLPEAYDAFSAGCNNEIERIFGSLNDETLINTITKDSPYYDHELQRAASRMAQCVIVILDRCKESNAVLRHYLPWLGDELDLCTTQENKRNTSDVRNRIQEGSGDAILAQNDMDEALFRFGRELFEEQVRIAQSA